jgi:hypothetical protein
VVGQEKQNPLKERDVQQNEGKRMMKLTSNMGSDDLSANIVLEEASDVFVVLIPLLEPEVKLSSGNGVETSELQGKVSRYGRGGGQ